MVFCNYALAEQVEIDLELLPQIEQERIKAAKLKHYYSELEEIKTRKEQCLSNKDVECVKHYEKLVIHLQQDLENTKSNLGQSDDWRYGLSIELLVKHFPIFANYQKQLKCDIARVGDSFYFEKTNNNQELVAVAAVECRSRNRIAYCDLIESSDSVPFSRKLNDIDYDQLIELWMLTARRCASGIYLHRSKWLSISWSAGTTFGRAKAISLRTISSLSFTLGQDKGGAQSR